MGREIRRVPLDFDWPLNKVWGGFVNPHHRKCPANCEGGYSEAYRAIAQHIRKLMWDRDAIHLPHYRAVTTALAGREPSLSLLGHDSCDAYSAVIKLGELAGLPDNWDTCDVCNGDGIDPAIADDYNAWERTDPPSGDGWQIWETVSEGSPISPVFTSKDALIAWLVSLGYSKNAATEFAKREWAMSDMVADGTFYRDISMYDAPPQKETDE